MNNIKYVNTKCPHCGKISTLEMTNEQYEQYISGDSYIQNIFPNWSPAIREMLITGICPDCWDKMFNFNKD